MQRHGKRALGRTHRWSDGRLPWVGIGVAGAVLAFVALASIVGLTTPPFRSADEAQHTAYALDVSSGRLPTLSTPLRSMIPGMPGLLPGCPLPVASAARPPARPDRGGPGLGRVRPLPHALTRPAAPCPQRIGAYLTTYTANHPPLFYAIEAVPLRLGVASGHAMAGFRAARFVNVAIGVAGLLAAAALVRLLVPSRPELAVATAAVTGLCTLYQAVSGQVYNDTLAVATITAALAGGVVVILRGPSRGRLSFVTLACLAAAASRAAGAETAALVVPAVGVGIALHTSGRWRRRVGLGVAGSAAVAGVVAAGIGWFYVRNIGLYGDPTGAGPVSKLFPVRPTPVWTALSSRHFWWYLYEGFWGRSMLMRGGLRDVSLAMLVATVVGAGFAAVRCVIARRRGVVLSPSVPMVAAWVLVIAHLVLVVATLLGYVSSGGAWFTRYLLPALPEGVLLFVILLAALPAARLASSAAILAIAVSAVVMAGRELALHDPGLVRRGTLGRLAGGLAADRIFHPDLVLGVILGVLVLAVLAVLAALWALPSSTHQERRDAALAGPPIAQVVGATV